MRIYSNNVVSCFEQLLVCVYLSLIQYHFNLLFRHIKNLMLKVLTERTVYVKCATIMHYETYDIELPCYIAYIAHESLLTYLPG